MKPGRALLQKFKKMVKLSIKLLPNITSANPLHAQSLNPISNTEGYLKPNMIKQRGSSKKLSTEKYIPKPITKRSKPKMDII